MHHNLFGSTYKPTINAGHGTATLSGSFKVGLTVTCTYNMDDPEGGETGIAYQWQRFGVGNISGANSSTYDLVAGDLGKQLQCVVTYTDGNGNAETVSSDVSAVVTKPNLTGTFLTKLDGASSNANPFTFSAVTFGSAAADRHIVVLWYGASLSAAPSSMTIGGIAATGIIGVGLTGIHSAIFIAKVPTGTSGDIVCTYGTTPNNINTIAVYSITGSGPLPVGASDTVSQFNSAGSLTKTYTTDVDTFVVSAFMYQAAANQLVTGTMTVDGTRVSSSNRCSFASQKPTGSSATHTIASFSGNKAQMGAVFTT